jgi:hypothetical protein
VLLAGIRQTAIFAEVGGNGKHLAGQVVGIYEITTHYRRAAVPCPWPSGNCGIAKKGPIPAVCACEWCNAQVKGDSIQEQFDADKCKPVDSSQKHLGIAKEATENH